MMIYSPAIVSCIHGDKTQDERDRALNSFKNQGRILVATDVAARGIDVKGIEIVVNYDCPNNVDVIFIPNF
jgi:superfamily II DNA/RNA helicase